MEEIQDLEGLSPNIFSSSSLSMSLRRNFRWTRVFYGDETWKWYTRVFTVYYIRYPSNSIHETHQILPHWKIKRGMKHWNWQQWLYYYIITEGLNFQKKKKGKSEWRYHITQFCSVCVEGFQNKINKIVSLFL